MFTVVSISKTYNLCQKIKSELKSNPNHWPIVDKWNYKFVYNKYKFQLFQTIEEEIEKEIPKYVDFTIKNLVNIKEL